jgi:dTDP-4-dehydrorhamnose 3,5-epimerase
MIDGVELTPLKIIEVKDGNVLHALKKSDIGFEGFGEAYFSNVESGQIKGWKRHREMTLNLICPVGKIKFVLCDDRNGKNVFEEFIISLEDYSRLTVPPMIWFGFAGLSEENSMLLNIANILHNDAEIDRKDLKEIDYNWNE